MKFQNGEITVSPKIIYWIGIPPNIQKADRVELFKKDIFIIEHDGDHNFLYELKKTSSKYTGYLYNLENLIFKNKINESNTMIFAMNILTLIKEINPERSLVHTSMINKSISDIFRSNGISYVERNLNDKKLAFSTLYNIIKPFFIEQGKLNRGFVRLDLLPLKFKAKITDLNNKICPEIECYVKDLGLNGISFVLKSISLLNFFEINHKASAKVFIDRHLIFIKTANIIRINNETGEISINFNLNDNIEMSEESSSILSSLIFDWINDVIKKYGKIESGIKNDG